MLQCCYACRIELYDMFAVKIIPHDEFVRTLYGFVGLLFVIEHVWL